MYTPLLVVAELPTLPFLLGLGVVPEVEVFRDFLGDGVLGGVLLGSSLTVELEASSQSSGSRLGMVPYGMVNCDISW